MSQQPAFDPMDRKEDEIAPMQNKPTVVTDRTTLPIAQARAPEPFSSNIEELDDALREFSRTFLSERRPRSTTNVVDVKKAGSVVVCNATDTIATCAEVLATESILGCGVVDDQERCVGCVDVATICRYLFSVILPQCSTNLCNLLPQQLCHMDRVNTMTNTNATNGSIGFDELKQCLTEECCQRIQQQIDTTSIQKVLDFEQSHHCCPVSHSAQGGVSTCHMGKQHQSAFCGSLIIPAGYNLLFAMQLLAQPGVQRLIIVNCQQKIVGYYSRSMALSDIRQNAHLLKPFTNITIEQCLQTKMTNATNAATTTTVATPHADVVSIPITATAFEAFYLMLCHKVSGLALLDVNGKLTGTLSIRDLRGLGARLNNIADLCLPIKDFKQKVLAQFPNLAPPCHWSSSSKLPVGARYISAENGTMRDVILAFADGLLQRVFVLDANNDMRGIVTFSDALKLLLSCMGVYSMDDQGIDVQDTEMQMEKDDVAQ